MWHKEKQKAREAGDTCFPGFGFLGGGRETPSVTPEPGRKGFTWKIYKSRKKRGFAQQNGSFANSQAVLGELAERERG